MCIAILSTAHPDYALILISNRDEFLDRPTASAAWWVPPDENVLGGRDLLRKEQGTWLGVTKQGRIAVLTNFREESQPVLEAKSRGGIVTSFLTGTKTTTQFIRDLFDSDDLHDVGGFNLICGIIGEPLAIISNRTSCADDVQWIGKEEKETVGLSNAAFRDRTWPKVIDGEDRLREVIRSNIQWKEDRELHLIADLLKLLSTDTLPKWEKGQDLESFIPNLRYSIFIPALGGDDIKDNNANRIAAARTEGKAEIEAHRPQSRGMSVSGLYGTQKQTVILVDHEERVLYVEKTLYDPLGKPKAEGQSATFDFRIKAQPLA